MLAPNACVALAEVARPHGIRGEVHLRLFNRDSNLLLSLDDVVLRFPDGQEQEVSVDASRRAQDAILMKLYSVDDRNRAEELRGAIVCARRGELPPLDAGEFYVCDVEGARVVVEDGADCLEGASGDASHGPDRQASRAERAIGTVRTLRSYPAADVLVVDAVDGGTPYEIPLVDAIVRDVDVERGVVRVRTLDGVERG